MSINFLDVAQKMTTSPRECFTIQLRGEISLANISGVHQRMLDAFDKDTDILIDASGLMAADLSLVQLIEAMRKSADRQGRMLAMSAPASGDLRVVLERGGFIGGDAGSFWLQGAVTQ